MRRVLQVSGLSGLLVTAFVPTLALAEEPANDEAAQPSDAQQPGEKPNAEQPAPVAPAVEVVAPATPPVAPAARPKFGDVSTSGYFRGGIGANVHEKGRQTCFALAKEGGLLSKYRLGNECEVWAEMEFKTVVYAGEDGVVGNLHFMPVAFIPTSYIGYSPTGVTSSDQGSPGTGATVAFPNLYVDVKGISWLFGGTPWVGTRYYKRESVYISDFFYWNPSGVGAGIEDVNLGKIWDSAPPVLHDLTLSYGVFAVDGQPSGSPQLPMQIDLGLRNDIQVRGFRPYESGEIQIGFQYIKDWSNDYSTQTDPVTNQTYQQSNTHGGWGVTVRHVQKVLDGDNKLVFQYGKGGGTGFGTLARFYYPDFSLNQAASESRIRVVDVLTIQPTDWFGAQVNGVYQHDDLGTTGGKTDWISAGTRLSFSFVDHAKFLWEGGYDQVKKNNGAPLQWLGKITEAVAIAGAKGFWGRPELRLFYTYARWNEAARIATVDSGRVYTSTNFLTGQVVGLQAEAIW